MDATSRSAVLAAVLIVGGTVLAAPGLGVVDLSATGESTAALGTGNVTVAAVSLPSTARFERGAYGGESFYLRVPTARIEFAATTGRPVLDYHLEIPALHYSRHAIYFIDSDTGRTLRLALPQESVEPELVTQSEYRGRLVVTLRANDTERVLAERAITVGVQR